MFPMRRTERRRRAILERADCSKSPTCEAELDE